MWFVLAFGGQFDICINIQQSISFDRAVPRWGIYPKGNHWTTIYTKNACCSVVYNNRRLEITSSLFLKYVTVYPYVVISYHLLKGWFVSIFTNYIYLLVDKIFKVYFFFFFGCIGSSLLYTGFSLIAASGGYSSLRCAGFSLQWLLLLWSTGSRCVGFSSCGTQAQ